MDVNFVMDLGRRALQTGLLLAAPVLVVTLVVGFLVAMLQAVTSIRDMTLGLVLKIACVGATLFFCGGWMVQVAVSFAAEVLNHMQSMGH